MANTVTIGGKHIPKWGVYGGIGVVVVGGVYFFKKKGSPSSSSSTAIDPITGLPTSQDNQIDPLTNMTYLAEAQQYGSVAAAEAAYAGSTGTAGSGYGSSGQPYSYGSSGYYPSSTTTTYATNGQWSQAAQDYLVNTVGLPAASVSQALGDYINGRPVDPNSTEYGIIEQARAFNGDPPVNGTNGHPPGINLKTSPPSGSGGGGPVKGEGAPQNLRTVQKFPGAVQIAWNPVTLNGVKATSYTVQTYNGQGKTVSGPFEVGGPIANVGGLHPGWTYHTQVWSNLGTAHSTVTYTLPK